MVTVPVHFLPSRPQTPAVLPVDVQWKCQRSGDCCTQPKEVVMTKQEAAVLVHHAPPTIQLQMRPVDEKFVAMKAGPCPLYAFQSCLVYEHRPYNCRRFACMRPDPFTEPFDGRLSAEGSIMRRAVQSRAIRRLLVRIQRESQRWAVKYGWTNA